MRKTVILKPEVYAPSDWRVKGIRTVEELTSEPMFFAATPEFIRSQNAPIHHEILDALESRGNYEVSRLSGWPEFEVVIDSRICQLMPGFIPSIPNWHCDDVPRTNGQPDFDLIDDSVQHFMVHLSTQANLSRTEFIFLNKIEIKPNKVYKSLNKFIKKNHNSIEPIAVEEGQIVNFDQQSIYRAVPAKGRGWRMFFRASITYRKPVNQIRQHTQVYVNIEDASW